MYQVDLMRPEDFSFATKLANTMNWNMEIDDFKLISSLEPQGCFVAFKKSEPIGIATSISYGKIGWFGNLIVKKEFRGQGVGSLLVKHAVNYLQSKGVETIGLYAYPDLKEFYEKIGFNVNGKFIVLHQENFSAAISKKMPIVEKQVFPALIQFDKNCFGSSRERLLEKIFCCKNNLCYYSSDKNEVNGYVAVKICGGLAEIGPLICQANQVDTAKLLLDTALSQLNGLYVTLCLQSKETALINHLTEIGFSENFSVLRMFLGYYNAKKCIYVPESVERG